MTISRFGWAFWTGFLSLTALAAGQSIDGNLVGTVSDMTGAVVPRAQITAKNRDTDVRYSSVTDAQGDYRLDHLPAGFYDVSAEAPQLSSPVAGNVHLSLNETLTVNLQLRVSSASTTIQVVEAPALLDTSTAQVQNNFDARALVDVPAASTGSGFLNLSLLGAGVASAGGLGLGVGPSVGGQRPTNNQFSIDGADDRSYFSPGPLATVSNEAIAEFTILQNQFEAETGGASGGIFNATVKTGGDQTHGSLYEYMQNRNLNAIDAQYARQGLTSPPRFDDNRLGGTIGGPILKNKLFYFGNFEYNPVGYAFAPASVIEAPTSAGYQTLAGMSGLSKTNLQVLQKYLPAAPAADDSTTVLNTTIPTGPLSVVAPAYANTYRVSANTDWIASASDQVHARYNYVRFAGIDTSASLPAFFVPLPSHTHLFSLSEDHIFTPDMQNQFQAAYSRNNSRSSAGAFNFPGVDSFPTFYLYDVGAQIGPDPNVPNGQVQGALQLSDHLTKTMGRHTIKAGYDFHDIIMTTSFVSYPRGYYWYSGLEQYLLDLTPDYFGQRTLGTTGPLVGGIPVGFLQNAAFAQDDIRVRPNLTINVGVRYEYVTVPIASRAQQFSALANVPGVLTFGAPQASTNDWSPRVGFAYSPGKSAVWSIRGGFGRFFDMPYANIAANTLPAFYGGLESVNLASSAPNFLANGGLTQPFPVPTTAAAARAGITTYSPDQNRPYALSYSLSVERLIGHDYTLEARYVGTKGVHLYVQEQLNRTSPVTATQNIPTFLSMPSASQLASLTLTTGTLKAIQTNSLASYGFTNSSSITAYEPIGNSEYNGLALQMTKRYSKSFSYIAAYTWSHLMDDSTATVNSTLLTPRRPQDFNDLSAEWASSMLDRRQRLSITPIYDFRPFAHSNHWALKNLVGNWNASLTYIYESPEYATVQSGVDSNLNNDSVGDRAIVNPAGIANVGSGVTPIDASGSVVSASSNSIVAYVANNPNARYIVAGLGAYANGARNTFPFDPINNVDASIRKQFDIGEGKRFDLGAQFFNLFNHPQFTAGYVDDVYQTKNTNRNFLIPSNGSFGQYQSFFPSNARYIQLVARITF